MDQPATVSATTPPSLPKGGGAVRDIGEKFGVGLATGTGTLSIPLPVSPGRSGFGPDLSLDYDSGSGNGTFGFGWHIGLPTITRKTDKGLPRYCDGEESDVFILSGAEDLVPVLDDRGLTIVKSRTLHDRDYQARFYRPRIEGLFARIERWTAVDTGVSHFRSITRDNIVTLYGLDDDSRITSPDDPSAVFSYLVCRSYDNRGNVIRYRYVPDDDRGVDRSLAHEANRASATRATQRYLKEIDYGNATPCFASWDSTGADTSLPSDWHFRVVFDFGDHTNTNPSPSPDLVWPVRPDPISQHRAAFEIRTYRRCQRVLVFHTFADETEVGGDCLVRSTDFRYSDQNAPADPRNPIYTFLTSVTQTGYRRQPVGYLSRSMPPLELTYSEATIQSTPVVLDADSAANLPEGIDGARYQWVDLDGEALSGALFDAGGAWSYKRNLSPLATAARFDAVRDIEHLPSSNGLDALHLLALSGDGQLDIVSFDPGLPGFFERTRDRSWTPFRPFVALPTLPWSTPNMKLVDLTGDGLADALLTEDGVFTFWPSLGARGFGESERVPTAWDEERGPAVVLADTSETVFLADMTGDGLSDVVRVRNGEICYWPNQGYGRFGAKVTMDDAPRFVDEARFDPRRVRLADIDGSGTTDLLYIADDGVYVCFNRCGNAWAAAQRLAVFPTADNPSTVQVFDLLGNGTACLVWSSPLPGQSATPLRYVDLMGGQKPHLLIQARNNLGAETRMHYAPSTQFYLADEIAGRPWVTRLPHIVHVVDRVETVDHVGRSRLVSRYAYHHGYFDGFEREFRGFGMVEQRDTEEHGDDDLFPELDDANWDPASWTPPVVTRTWFHTGAFLDAPSVSKQFAHEYWVEPGLRPTARSDARAAMELPDSTFVSTSPLTGFELQEAYRALKGSALRIEVYADDNSALADNPYAVTEHSYTVERVQSRAGNKHAVFVVHPREVVSLHYERRPDDPRVTHDVTLETGPFGNVKRAVSIGYPRRAGYADPEPMLAPTFRDMLAYDQTRLHVAAVDTRFTNDLADLTATPDVHRTPATSESIRFEWTGIAPISNLTGITNRFAFTELDALWKSFAIGTHDIAYEEVPASDIDGTGRPALAATRRIVEHVRTLYRKDDLTALAAPDRMESMALAGESYRLALTRGMVSRVLGTRVVDSDLAGDGGYVHFDGDSEWWIPSGRVGYSSGDTDDAATELVEARAHFYLPRRTIDPFGAIARVEYSYDLLPTATVDSVGNTTAAVNDYRVLQARQLTDPNGNRNEVVFDALGLVVGTAVMGKASETLGDSLVGFVADLDEAMIAAHLADPLTDPAEVVGAATTRLIYDLTAVPTTVYTVARETHVSDLAAGQSTRYQHSLSYADGFGREIQKKVQAEPGPLAIGADIAPRWVGTGWTIFNNKGKPVRKYEPFFTATHEFEFAHIVGVSTTLLYDSSDRVVATLHPNQTWEKIVFDAWRQDSWDVNDTATILDPRHDADVGDRFVRVLGPDPADWRSWYAQRIGGALGLREQAAAKAVEAHAETWSVAHFDALGRTCLTVADNGTDGRYPLRTAIDSRGKPLAVFDALGRRVFEYCVREARGTGFVYVAGTDLAGRPIFHNGMDGGERRGLADVGGHPYRAWDALGRAFATRYDAARRVTHRYVTEEGATTLLERTVYGEGMADRNLCARVYQTYDSAGVASNDGYDLDGNLIASSRQLAIEYRKAIDWTPLALLADPVAIALAAQPMLVAADRFVANARFDAFHRAIQMVTPHNASMNPNIVRITFNEANLLERIDAWLQQPASPTALLDSSTADLHAVTSIDYDARGQRVAIQYGSGAATAYTYDPLTFRLASLTTTRGTFAPDERTVQALSYTYDPVGNIIHVQDDADIQDVVYFRNQRVEPSSDYTYDAIYRLKTAIGREHLGQIAGALQPAQQTFDDDTFRMSQPLPGDGKAMGTYAESYTYDPAGNLLAIAHQVASGSWTRNYGYAEPSLILAGEINNRLSATSLPGDLPDAYTARYEYDAHGSMTRMPHLPRMTWDQQDLLRSTTQQVVRSGTPETTYYTYDAGGQRICKVTDGQASEGIVARRAEARIYLGGVEIHRRYDATGKVSLERETLQLSDGANRVVLVERRTTGSDPGLSKVIRYQHGNHLGSACLELDDVGAVITYEEYFPYGSTSFQSVRSKTETPKRYRYTAKERDTETGLAYHGARYYAPWLARWTSTDPIGISDGLNLYTYVKNQPITHWDPTGLAAATETGLKRVSQNVKNSIRRASEAIGKGTADIDHVQPEKVLVRRALNAGLSEKQFERLLRGTPQEWAQVDSAINQARQETPLEEWVENSLPNSTKSVHEVRASLTGQTNQKLVAIEVEADTAIAENIKHVDSLKQYSSTELARIAKDRGVILERPLNAAETARKNRANDLAGEAANRRERVTTPKSGNVAEATSPEVDGNRVNSSKTAVSAEPVDGNVAISEPIATGQAEIVEVPGGIRMGGVGGAAVNVVLAAPMLVDLAQKAHATTVGTIEQRQAATKNGWLTSVWYGIVIGVTVADPPVGIALGFITASGHR